MISFNNTYATVFNPSRNDRGIALAGMTTGRKQKNNDIVTYVNSSWGNAAFLGEAAKKFDTLKNLDRIYITQGRIERVKGLDSNGNEIKDAKGKTVFYLNISIFDFIMASEVASKNQSPTEDSSSGETLPF